MSYSDASLLFGNPYLNAATRKMRILLVEDDAELSAELKTQLNGLFPDAEVEQLARADALVPLLTVRDPGSCPYDLVISDFLVPGCYSGIDLWSAWRKAFPATPFLLISGILSTQSLHLQQDLGFEAAKVLPEFLPKPFSSADWRKAVLRLLDAA